MFRQLLLTAFLIAPLKAQIYADFTVSSGGNLLGTFTVTLDHVKAPRTCANFIGLASGKRPWIDVTNGAVRTNTPYYDGLTFHRLIHSFVIQGGSPNGQGTDGPGYTILDEYHPDLDHSEQYVLSMAKSGFPNTGGSQFFITLRATPELDDKHSVFGTVTSGTSIIEGFKNSSDFPTGANNKPTTSIVMDSVVISGEDYETFDIDAPALRLPHVIPSELRPIRDSATNNFTVRFDRKAKTNYFFASSEDLLNWTPTLNLFGLDASPDFGLNYGTVTAPKFYTNMATVSYDQIPDALADLVSTERTVRIRYPDNSRLDLTLSADSGTWSHSDETGTVIGSGLLENVAWFDAAPETGYLNDQSSQDFRLPLGRLSVDFDNPAGPAVLSALNTYLSFHTPSSGWLEETSSPLPGNDAIRLPFEILSN